METKAATGRRGLFLSLFLALVFSGEIAWCAPFNLKLGTYFPASDAVRYEQAQFLAKAIAEKTQQRVKIEIFPAEQLAKAKEAVSAVASGAVDMYLPYSAHYGGTFKVFDLVCQSFIYPSFDISHKAITDVTTLLDQDFQRHSIKVPFAYVGGTLDFFSSDKFYKGSEDLKGVKMAGIGGAVDKMLKSLGAGMVSITSPERYLALQRKVVDATITTNATFWYGKLYEVAPFATIVDAPLPAHFLIVNMNKWNQFPDDIKKAFLEVGPDVQKFATKTFMALDQEIYRDLPKRGGKIYFSTAKEKQLFRNQLLKVVEEGLKAEGPLGQKALDITKKYSQ